MAQNTPAIIATKEATSAKNPLIIPLTKAINKITRITMSKTFTLNYFCKSTLYFYKLKMQSIFTL